MKTYFFMGICLVALACHARAELDPFSVYREKAPQGCLDKQVGQAPLTLTDLISIGICNNPKLNKGYMAVKVAEADLGQQKSEYLPSVAGRATFESDYSKQQKEKSLDNDPYSGNVALEWLLYDFGGRSARNEQTKAYLQAAQFSYNSALQDIVFNISQAYYNLLGNEEVLRSAKATEESLKKSYDEAARRFELGLVSASDKLLANTSYQQSKLAVTQAQNAVKTSKGDLASLLNLPPETTFNLMKPKRTAEELNLDTKKSVTQLIDLALSLRPEIKSSKSTLEASRQNVNIAKASALPSISVSSGVAYKDDWKSSNPYQYSTNVGLSLSVPLFTGFSDTYKISRAKYQMEQAALDVADTEDTVRNEVWTAFQDYQTAVSSYEISKTVLESAIENRRVAFAMYQVGRGSIINLLTAESQLATARQENIVSFYGVLTAKAKLYRAIGRFN